MDSYCCICRYSSIVPDHGDTKVSVLDLEEQHSPGGSLDRFSSANSEISVDDDDEEEEAEEEIIDEHRTVSRAVSPTDEIDVPHKVLTQPNGTVIIEKLDTPAIRRERFMRRKAEKQKLAEASIPTGSTHRESRARVQSGSKSVAETEKDEKLPSYDNFEDESDLSELSEDESQELENETQEAVGENLLGKRGSGTHQRKFVKKKATKVDQYPESTIGSSFFYNEVSVCLQ